MTERAETHPRAPDSYLSPNTDYGCLGNGCGDFGFIEDVSTLIALKTLVDEMQVEGRPVERSPAGTKGRPR